jgi:hypothetical protein
MSDDVFDRKTPSPAEREAQKAFRQVSPDKPSSDRDKAQKAFHDNRERLKSERIAREAATAKRPKS